VREADGPVYLTIAKRAAGSCQISGEHEPYGIPWALGAGVLLLVGQRLRRARRTKFR
jgi:hypothetical protein